MMLAMGLELFVKIYVAINYNQLQDAKRLYQETVKKPFRFEHCWDILRNAPKWQNFTKEKQPRSSTATSAVDIAANVKNALAGAGGGDAGTRPPGRKAEKKRKREGGVEEALAIIAEKQDTMVKATNRKVEVLNAMYEAQVVGKSLEGMDELQKEFYILKRNKIMDRLRAEAGATRERQIE